MAAMMIASCINTAVAEEPRAVRDAIWVWAHAAGSYDNQYGLPGKSRMTPIEGAKSLGVPNLIMVGYQGKPSPPFDELAATLRPLRRVMWSIVGAAGTTSARERDAVLELAAKMPNLRGVFMDDFFRHRAAGGDEEQSPEPTRIKPAPAAMSLDELEQFRKRLEVGGRRLDLGVTLYTHQLDRGITPYLRHIDVVSLWTWEAAELSRLEDNFARYEKLAPGKRTLLGIYMWDFGKEKPMPLEMMEKQCRLALQWLRAGRIEGMIFVGTNICDLDLEAVNWTRRWIAEKGDVLLEGK
jgi:hypothetical protein